MQKELEFNVKELKAFLDERGVTTSGILEKSELLALAKDNRAKKPPLHIEVVSDTICPWYLDIFRFNSCAQKPSLVFIQF